VIYPDQLIEASPEVEILEEIAMSNAEVDHL